MSHYQAWLLTQFAIRFQFSNLCSNVGPKKSSANEGHWCSGWGRLSADEAVNNQWGK